MHGINTIDHLVCLIVLEVKAMSRLNNIVKQVIMVTIFYVLIVLEVKAMSRLNNIIKQVIM